jgi:hypothetical protein
MAIRFKYKKSRNTEKAMEQLKEMKINGVMLELDRFGQMGVDRLKAASPVRTGLMSNSWYYEIIKNDKKTAIIWYNTDIENRLNVAIIVDQGHATKGGGWIKGQNFIEPAMQPVYEALDKYLKEEVFGS